MPSSVTVYSSLQCPSQRVVALRPFDRRCSDSDVATSKPSSLTVHSSSQLLYSVSDIATSMPSSVTVHSSLQCPSQRVAQYSVSDGPLEHPETILETEDCLPTRFEVS